MYGVLPTNACEAYSPIRLDLDQARLLETRPGAPTLQVERTLSDQHGRRVEFVRSTVRNDAFTLRLHLSRSAMER